MEHGDPSPIQGPFPRRSKGMSLVSRPCKQSISLRQSKSEVALTSERMRTGDPYGEHLKVRKGKEEVVGDDRVGRGGGNKGNKCALFHSLYH